VKGFAFFAILIFLATVFLLGIGRLDGKRWCLVPATFDFGTNEREEHLVVVGGDSRADNVELERLRVFNRTGGA
jgi:hypothetical protein